MSKASEDTVRRVGWAILAVSLVYPFLTVWNANDGDTLVYLRAANAFLGGPLPYRDQPLEYPPYALPFFLLPRLFKADPVGFLRVFSLEMLALDIVTKALLLRVGTRSVSGFRGLLPLLVFAIDGWLQAYLYLKRFDLVPSTLVVVSLVLFFANRAFGAGAVLAIAIGAKLYPIVLVPALLVTATRRGGPSGFIKGLAAGFAPLALLSFVLPWWRFLAFHSGRGLQVESIAASIVWWLHGLGVVDAEWTRARGWFDVTGPAAALLTLPSKAAFAGLVLGSVLVASRRALRAPPENLGEGARIFVLPLLAFITWNTVLSPQYLIWTAPLVALSTLTGARVVPVTMLAAALLIPIYYPGRAYYAGLPLLQTTVLLLRNALLVTAWWMVVRDVLQTERRRFTPS